MLLALCMIQNVAGPVVSRTSQPGWGEIPHALNTILKPLAHFTVATNDRFASSLSHRKHRRLWYSCSNSRCHFSKVDTPTWRFAFFAEDWLLLVQTRFLWAAILSVWKRKHSAMCEYWAEIGGCPTAIITSAVAALSMACIRVLYIDRTI